MNAHIQTRGFDRFARKSRLEDVALRIATDEAQRGLVGADLGGGVIKQRIASPGAGKSGGFRTIILFRTNKRAIYVYGFAKNERDNIEDKELAEFRRLSAIMLACSEAELLRAIETGALIEVV